MHWSPQSLSTVSALYIYLNSAYTWPIWSGCTLGKPAWNPSLALGNRSLISKPASVHRETTPLIHDKNVWWPVNYYTYYSVLSTATISSSASPQSVNAMNVGTSCHCCANSVNRRWRTEAWRNVYPLRPSSNAVIFLEHVRVPVNEWWCPRFDECGAHTYSTDPCPTQGMQGLSTSPQAGVPPPLHNTSFVHDSSTIQPLELWCIVSPCKWMAWSICTFISHHICTLCRNTCFSSPNPWRAPPPLWISQ